MPHHVLGLGWGELVSIVTLAVVIANYFKSSISRTAHDSTRDDLEKLNSRLTNFQINVERLNTLLTNFNESIKSITRRVDAHDSKLEDLSIDIAKIKEHLGIKDDKKG